MIDGPVRIPSNLMDGPPIEAKRHMPHVWVQLKDELNSWDFHRMDPVLKVIGLSNDEQVALVRSAQKMVRQVFGCPAAKVIRLAKPFRHV